MLERSTMCRKGKTRNVSRNGRLLTVLRGTYKKVARGFYGTMCSPLTRHNKPVNLIHGGEAERPGSATVLRRVAKASRARRRGLVVRVVPAHWHSAYAGHVSQRQALCQAPWRMGFAVEDRGGSSARR